MPEGSLVYIPVIVLTSLSQKNEGKVLQAGAAAYVSKTDKLLEGDSSLLALVNTLGPKEQSAAPSN